MGLTAVLLAGCFLNNAVLAATISGTVFEDVNYGGGAGRSLAASGGVGIAGVRVEVYSGDTYVTAITTGTGGTFSYTYGGNSARTLRVVNGTVRSSRATCTSCVAVQTFRTTGTGDTATPVTNHVGGEVPSFSDAASRATGQNLSDLTTGTQTAQSIATFDPTASGITISNADFGFNFDTIVNTHDVSSCTATTGTPATFYPCQGTLRQFIINANALTSGGTPSQSGNGQLDGSNASLPSGYESSIFMIPSGAANAGQNTGYTNQLTGGVAIIALTAALPTVTGNNTRLDATTQTVNVGNTNAGTLNFSATVGVDAISMPAVQRPEVQLNAGNTAITLSGASQHILGFALQQGFIMLSGTSAIARNNGVGMTATGDSSANTTGIGIAFQGTGAIVRNNFVTVNNSGIRTDSGGAGSFITLNDVARPASGHTTTYDGILLVGTVSSTQVVANLARDQMGGGIEIGFGGGATASSITVSNNTVQNNGYTSGSTASTEPVGFVGYAYTGSNIQVTRNRIVGNAGAGALLMSASGTTISQNSFSNNGGLSIDLDNRGVDPNSMSTLQGVTLNDLNDVDTGPNGLLNYAVITAATIMGPNLTLTGYARPGSAIELYIAQPDPSGFGEGLTYLGTLTEGSGADLDNTTGTYGPGAINGILQGTDNTNRFRFLIATPGGVAVGTSLSSTATVGGETSEFGGNVVVTGGPSLQHLKSVQVLSDPVNGTTNPKSIPRSVQLYTLRITNQGAGAVDTNSVTVTDAIAANTKLFVGDILTPGSGPVAFAQGTPSSGLSWTFTALNNNADDLAFSNDGGTTWNYTPTADADGCDVAVTHIRMTPKGTMPGNGGGNPYFELRFHVLVR